MRRNPDDPRQIRIAVHELAHAVAWRLLELDVVSVTHTGDEGEVHVRHYDRQWREYAIGLWAGYEAEIIWSGGARRGNSSWDINQFRRVVKGKGLSESRAQSEARSLVRPHIGRIERLAPQLIRTGRLSGSRI